MAVTASQIREIKALDVWKRQVWYWRTHLDMFVEEYLKIKLKDTQHVQIRAIGNCDTVYCVQSRGYGKTWAIAAASIALCILYPGTAVAIVSGTAEQAVLVVKKIDDYFSHNPDVMRELEAANHKPVVVNRSKGVVRFKNGSKIESYSIGTFRGNRAKVIIVDEAPEVKQEDLTSIVKPVRNYTRENCLQYGFADYKSKMVSITSACLKSNYFFDAFVDTLSEMAKGNRSVFAYALDYNSAARVGITPMEFFLEERRTSPDSKFMLEYGSIFVGAEAGSVFPYELTEKCRTLKEVETAQPAKSNSDYVISVDLATSSAENADNAVVCVLKLTELENGMYLKKLVFIRSFHGKRLDTLATEVRKLLVKFPNTSKLVVDCRGLGDAFPQFMCQPWTDPETNKEYPPIVPDNERSMIHNAIPLLHPVIANIAVNQQLVSSTTVALEQRTLELPVNSRSIIDNRIITSEEDSDSSKKLTLQERAIFIETDALQIEMGNIVGKTTGAGNVIYDSAKSTQHKDRYSALSMGVWYVAGIEEERRKKYLQSNSDMCIGIVSSI